MLNIACAQISDVLLQQLSSKCLEPWFQFKSNELMKDNGTSFTLGAWKLHLDDLLSKAVEKGSEGDATEGKESRSAALESLVRTTLNQAHKEMNRQANELKMDKTNTPNEATPRFRKHTPRPAVDKHTRQKLVSHHLRELPRRLSSKLAPLLLRYLYACDQDWTASVQFTLGLAKDEEVCHSACDGSVRQLINKLLVKAYKESKQAGDRKDNHGKFFEYVTSMLKFNPLDVNNDQYNFEPLIVPFQEAELHQWVQLAQKGEESSHFELKQLLESRLRLALTPFPRRAWEMAVAEIKQESLGFDLEIGTNEIWTSNPEKVNHAGLLHAPSSLPCSLARPFPFLRACRCELLATSVLHLNTGRSLS